MQILKTLAPGFALAVLAALPLTAQESAPTPAQTPGTQQTSPSAQPGTPSQPGASSQPGTSPQSGSAAVPVPSTSNPPEISNPDLRPVTGELVSKLDSKDAKSGDQIVLKTTQPATFSDGVVIPKGSKITGHITQVQPHASGNETAKLMVQFDQAQLKTGQALPIKALLQSVTPANGTTPDNTVSGSTPNSQPSAPAGGSSSSAATGSPSNSPAPGAQAQGGSTAPAPGAANTPAGPPPAGTVVAQHGNIAIQTTGIPGVFLATNASGQLFSNASGGLLGARQDVHLDTGTQLTLAVSDGNAKASNR